MWSQVAANTIAQAAPIALVAIGLAALYRVTRLFDLTLGAAYSISGYSAYAFIVLLKLPLGLALPLALAAGIIVVVATHQYVYSRLRRQPAGPLGPLVAALSIVIVAQNLIALLFGDTTLSLRGSQVQTTYAVGSARLTSAQLLIITLTLVIALALLAVFRLTRLGPLLRALTSSPSLAIIRGLPVGMLRWVAIVGAACLASLAGILSAYDTDLVPHVGYDVLIPALAAALLPTSTFPLFAAVAAVGIAAVSNGVALAFTTEWQSVGPAVLLLAVVTLRTRPYSLLGDQRDRE